MRFERLARPGLPMPDLAAFNRRVHAWLDPWFERRWVRRLAILLAAGFVLFSGVWIYFASGLPSSERLLAYQAPLPTNVRGYDGNPVATFSPNGSVLDGRFADGAPAALRPLSGQNVASNMPAPAQNCIRHPASGYCADAADINIPTAFPLWVRGLHPLTIRAQPTMASDKLGETTPGQCFMIDACQATPEGTRCHIAPGQNSLPTGYVLKPFSKMGDLGPFFRPA